MPSAEAVLERPESYVRVTCRMCQSRELKCFLDLGDTALANSFLKPGQSAAGERKFKLDLCFCSVCGQVQLGTVVAPEIMFRDYIYVSSTSDTIPKHFAECAREAVERFMPSRQGLVAEVASNDGCLLKGFQACGVNVVGIEPAVNIAKMANDAGVPTVNEFFTEAVGARVREQYGPASLICGNNVFAHVDDLDEFVKGFLALLAEDGVVILESPHLAEMVKKLEFDTAYHEHVSYLSLRAMDRLFGRFDMSVFDVRKTGVHGGSVRYFIRRGRAEKSEAAKALLAEEGSLGLHRFGTYERFAADVQALRRDLMGLLRRLKAEGKRLAGYGAPAKGNTLLQYCGIGGDLLDYLVDKSSLKQGTRAPGTHLDVFSPEKLMQDRPDYVLILAWNFADEIMRQQSEYRATGGRFILPVPSPRIV